MPNFARLLGVALLAAVCLVSLPVPRAAHAQDRHVLGYYVPYDPTSWRSLQAHADDLDLVGAQWVTIDACGNLGSHDDQTLKQLSASHHLQVVPSLLTSSGWLNHRLLTDEPTTEQALAQIVAYTLNEGYAGFDLDLEAVDATDRPALSSFVDRLAGTLHAQGKFLTLAIPAKERDVTVGWAGAYDYAALGASADLVTIMAYQYRGPFSGPGSVAPYDWVARVLAFSTQQIAPQKVLLGLALYGYDWNTTSGGARALGYPQAAALADRYGAPVAFDPSAQSATFSYTGLPADAPVAVAAAPALAHQITVRVPSPCGIAPPPPPPAPTRAPTPLADQPQAHEVWVEDSASAAARFGLADTYAAAGIATWRLGLEDPRFWTPSHNGDKAGVRQRRV